jgi:hypothetical protein
MIQTRRGRPQGRPLSCIYHVGMRVLVVLSSVALLVVASAQATVRRGGLHGLVTRGPVVPVCSIEVPCDAPAPGVTLLFFRNDRMVGRALTDQNGRYALRLPAGVYTVSRPAAASSLDRKLEPNRVRVYAGRLSRVDFSIDTGIR